MGAWEAPKRFCPHLYLQLSIIKLIKWTVFHVKIQISNFSQDPPPHTHLQVEHKILRSRAWHSPHPEGPHRMPAQSPHPALLCDSGNWLNPSQPPPVQGEGSTSQFVSLWTHPLLTLSSTWRKVLAPVFPAPPWH